MPSVRAANQRCDQEGTLVTRTRILLRTDQRTLHEIAMDAYIPFYWLAKFSSGEITQPSANRVQYLYEHLTQSRLAVLSRVAQHA